jgi:Ca2+-binding RTX toxin-like protein
MEGRSGNDRLFGGSGEDEMLGGEGDDELRGGAGDDVLWGGKGEDRLFGDTGSDTLLGEIGDDYVDGGRFDSDNLSGGKGNDTIVTEFVSGELNDELIFGDEGEDNFQILDALTAAEQFLVKSQFAARETQGTSDFEANEDFHTFVEAVVNQAPTIVSVPPTTATVAQLYTYEVVAVDPDIGDVLSYILEQAPSGMTIDSSTGLIQWVPAESQVGNHTVKVIVIDTGALLDDQIYTLTVTA